jgi:hypothetical protein
MAKYKLHKSDQVLINVHSKKVCKGEYCCVHNPSNHHMADWEQVWREDRRMMERICPEHSCGHPDPDDPSADRTHGCCGCCRPPETNK